MTAEQAELINPEKDIAFWKSVLKLKREIKWHEKEISSKRKALSVAFNEMCDRFVLSPSSETEK